MTLVLATPLAAQTIASQSTSTPFAGVRVVEGRTSGPATSFSAAYISLCNDYVHVDASSPESLRTSGNWAQSVGAQLAVNGDFYAFANNTSHVYGDAVGSGTRWPSIRTGHDDAYASSWFYMDYGWIAFGNGWVEYSNSKHVKRNPQIYGATEGYRPTSPSTNLPAGTLALVSGFPQLVIEGKAHSCPSPTTTNCFPDRGDMQSRHPRTAMGLSRDRKTFILVAVDGRTTGNSGMYGTELAKLMHDLGAWTAFNLDGGGSTQMWLQGRGTINTPSDGSPRSVLNSWGIFAGSGSGKGRVPGSCDQIIDEVLHQSHIYETGTTSDIDGDGRADVCGRGPEGIECALSQGNGFGTTIAGPTLRDSSGWADPTNYSTIRMGDINGDGRADICARANARVNCWLSDGTGFPTRIDGPALSNAEGFDDLKYFSTLRIADFNGDGMDDVCVRTADDFRCYPSTGTGFSPAVIGPPLSDASGWGTPDNYGSIRMADINGDGRADVCARANAGVRCWLSNGNGFPTRIDGPTWSNALGWNDIKHWSTIRMGDINADGRADICGRGPDGMICHLSQGNSFGPAIVGPALSDADGWGDYDNYSTIRLADVDGDGTLDLCGRANAGMRCWLWDGEKFGRRITGGLADDTGWNRERFYRTIQFADVNDDGRADLCARASAGWMCWLSDGNGFPTRIDGPPWSDASGWGEAKYYATIRSGGPRRQADPGEQPGEDVAVSDDVAVGGDVAVGEDVAAAQDVGLVADVAPLNPSDTSLPHDASLADAGSDAPPSGAEVETTNQTSASASSCTCTLSPSPHPAAPLALAALGLCVGVIRRAQARLFKAGA
ncbi:MAG: phosphodiester glycosidase family protein [Bradymonadaceae bacterium]|nr:phosphodiester glycosidase family protein [Lujinxingiaceae bacterium]